MDGTNFYQRAYTEWVDNVTKMQGLHGFSIQRKSLITGSVVQWQLHGFFNASEQACVHIRSKNSRDEVHLICSKSRVTPIKSLSIPRLELCGAQLLIQLMAKVETALEMDISSTYHWADSTIVLNWIRATNKKLLVFVAYRIGEIQDKTNIGGGTSIQGKTQRI